MEPRKPKPPPLKGGFTLYQTDMTSRSKTPSSSSDTSEQLLGSPTVPQPVLQFEGPPKPLKDILDKYPLPRVVKCDPSTAPQKGLSALDLTQPLLAYCTRTARKVNARSVLFDPSKKEAYAVGKDLLIPEDYTGWFAILGPPDKIMADQAVPHYRSVAHLSTSRCNHFLVGGMRPLQGILTEGRHHGDNSQMLCDILPGTVLRKGGLYREQFAPGKPKKKTKKGKEPPQPRQFLMCTDKQGREMLVHTGKEGAFYIIDQEGAPVKHPILQMKDILTRYELPLVVKLVYGRVPSTPCAFTATLLLTNSGKNHTVVASTLFNHRNINLELPIASSMTFLAAENTPGLLGSRAYVNAFNVCRDQAHSYVTNIKVIFGNPHLEKDEAYATIKEEMKKKKNTNKSVDASASNAAATGHDEEDVQLRIPTRSASRVSRSQMEDMLKRVTINGDDGEFDPPSPATTPPVGPKKPVSQPSDQQIPAIPPNVIPCKTYEHPKPQTIPIKSVKSNPSETKISETGGARREAFQTQRSETHVYDNRTLPRQPEVSTDAEHVYIPVWGRDGTQNSYVGSDKRKSTISIPCVPGKPDSHGQASYDSGNYLARPIYPDETSMMDSTQQQTDISCSNKNQAPKVLPKPCQQNKKNNAQADRFQAVPSHLPDIPAPPLPHRKPPESSDRDLHGGHDSETSAAAERESLSETSMDEDNVYININLMNLQKVDDQNLQDRPWHESGALHKNYDQLSQADPKPNYSYDVPSSTSHSSSEWSSSGERFSKDLQNDGYLVPVDVSYVTNDELGGYVEPTVMSVSTGYLSGPYENPDDIYMPNNRSRENPYVELKELENRIPSSKRSTTTDSGVFEDDESLARDENHNISDTPSGFMKELHNQIKSRFPRSTSSPGAQESSLAALRPSDSNISLLKFDHMSSKPQKPKPHSFGEGDPHLQNIKPFSFGPDGPPLPRRPKEKSPSTSTPPPLTLGQTVLKSVPSPAPSGTGFTQANKEMLIEMLKDAGISTTTELAIQGLQAADIATVLQKGDDFDDGLIALLPKVGQVDLRKIAMILKSMKLST